MKNKFLLHFFSVFLALFLISCGGDGSDKAPIQAEDNFDRTAMLSNIYDNMIIPSFDDFDSKLIVLESDLENFTSDPNSQELLNALRSSWEEAYISWQNVELFSHFGLGEEMLYGFKMNTYPTDVVRTTNIINGIAVFNSIYSDNQGFPAFDYMLFGIGSDDDEIIAVLNNPVALSFLNNIFLEMKNNTLEIKSFWEDQQNSFPNDNGNTATSNTNLITNDFIYYYEKGLRTNKFGIPCGHFSPGTTYPEKVEAYYKKDLSKTLAIESLKSVKNFFEGTHFNNESQKGESLATYLNHLGQSDLSEDIISKLEDAEIQINSLSDNFAEQIINDNSEMQNTFDLLQSIVVKLKIDMLYHLTVNVDYNSGDGD